MKVVDAGVAKLWNEIDPDGSIRARIRERNVAVAKSLTRLERLTDLKAPRCIIENEERILRERIAKTILSSKDFWIRTLKERNICI